MSGVDKATIKAASYRRVNMKRRKRKEKIANLFARRWVGLIKTTASSGGLGNIFHLNLICLFRFKALSFQNLWGSCDMRDWRIGVDFMCSTRFLISCCISETNDRLEW